MDKQVARYVHRQNPDTTEIWDGGVLPERVIPEYFQQCNIPNENVDILLLFSYIQLTPNKFSFSNGMKRRRRTI